MPEAEPRRLTQLVEAMADGTPIDWDDAESSAATDQERLIIRRLSRIGLAASLQRRPAVPTMWGQLVLLEKVGEGAFGDVFRAHDPKLERDVALKLLHEPMAARGARASAVIEEGRLLARVRHPNVVTVYGAEILNGQVGIWTEFIEGQTLQTIVAERGPLPVEEVISIGIEVCRALAAVHDAGLLHRDIKAQNVMRESTGRIVLMDFGTGRDVVPMPGRARDVSGTPLYLAPEVFQGSPASVRSDLYSVGVLLYYLVSGRFPIGGRTLGEVEAAHRNQTRARLHDVGPDLPAPFIDVVERALNNDPAARFNDVTEIETALTGASELKPVSSGGTPWWRRPFARWGIAAVLVAALAAWEAAVYQAPERRAWILITSFENRTSDPHLDRMEEAIAYALRRSPVVDVVPPERIDDALRLMRKAPGSRVDADLGREICLRDGAIKALLTGRIESFDSGYRLTATVLDPAKNVTVGEVYEDNVRPAELDAHIEALSDRVRQTIGESIGAIARRNQELAKVVTPSFEAVKLYTEASRLLTQMVIGTQVDDVISLLRKAIAEDPGFASAYTLLAVALSEKQNTLDDECLAMAKRGFDLADTVSERERYFIRATYFHLAGQLDEAIKELEDLHRQYPADFHGVQDLADLYNLTGRPGARELRLQYADSRPNDVLANAEASFAYSLKGDRGNAEKYFNRAASADPGDAAASRSAEMWIQLAPVRNAWLADQPREAWDALTRLEAAIAGDGSPLRNSDRAALNLGSAYATLGRMEGALAQFRRIPDAGTRTQTVAALAFLRDDVTALRTEIKANPEGASYLDTSLLIHAGFLREAAARIVDLRRTKARLTIALEGDLALAQNNTTEGIRILEKELPRHVASPHPTIFMAAEALAKAYEYRSDLDSSIRVLKQFSDGRLGAAPPRGSMLGNPFWLRNQAQLARTYRIAGKPVEANAVEDQLRTLLAIADDDHPIVVQLRHATQTPGVVAGSRQR